MFPKKLPKNLNDAQITVSEFPYKFVLDLTGNLFCEDLIGIWVCNRQAYGILAALDALDAANANYDLYPAGNWLQRWLTARWLERQLAI